jgi:hypothetical protein
MTCEDGNGGSIEVVAKFAHRCERGVNALIAEGIAAMLAADLDLPVPEPYIVAIDEDLKEELSVRILGKRPPDLSVPAFGSKLLTGFATLPRGKQVSAGLLQSALEILAFDVVIQNSDRLPGNPNCLTDGQHFAIIDHELSFLTEGVIGWRPPWEHGALDYLRIADATHLFYESLRGKTVNLDRLVGALEAVGDERLHAYLEALPEAWIGTASQENQMIDLLTSMRDNIDGIVTELRGALT